MRSAGIWMLVLGVGAFVLPYFGLQFKILSIFGDALPMVAGGNAEWPLPFRPLTRPIPRLSVVRMRERRHPGAPRPRIAQPAEEAETTLTFGSSAAGS